MPEPPVPGGHVVKATVPVGVTNVSVGEDLTVVLSTTD